MADFLISSGSSAGITVNRIKSEDQTALDFGRGYFCNIFGQKGTFTAIQDAEDAIIAIGYVNSIEGNSVQETLSHLLQEFRESQVIDLKKQLVGEFVLLVKKGMNIFIFSDFVGVRNVFYSDEGVIISSSFSRVEDALQTKSSDLDAYKVLEYIAMRHVLYPAWLGRSTYHKHINWLLPYEYLVIDIERAKLRVSSIVYEIDNRKQTDCSLLAKELLSTLTVIMARKEFKNLKVASSLTGGRDSRLISAIAKNEFANIHFRTSVSQENPSSLKDVKVASKIAKILQVPHDIYRFRPGRDEKRFVELTEGLSPEYNQAIAPLIDSAGVYSLGFGGAFGSELFMPIPWNLIEDYVREKVKAAKQVLRVEDTFWEVFRKSLDEQFQDIRAHFKLSIDDERDYIRLFSLLDTARYGSFIISAYNQSGYQIDPYGSYAVLDLALRVAPALWGSHKKISGNSLVQKSAMGMLNPRIGALLTYKHSRPMLPLTVRTFPRHLLGFAIHLAEVLKNRSLGRIKKPIISDLPGGIYLSDGWEIPYLTRTGKKYGMPASIMVSSPEKEEGPPTDRIINTDHNQ